MTAKTLQKNNIVKSFFATLVAISIFSWLPFFAGCTRFLFAACENESGNNCDVEYFFHNSILKQT